jgi:hypothetical protein
VAVAVVVPVVVVALLAWLVSDAGCSCSPKYLQSCSTTAVFLRLSVDHMQLLLYLLPGCCWKAECVCKCVHGSRHFHGAAAVVPVVVVALLAWLASGVCGRCFSLVALSTCCCR